MTRPKLGRQPVSSFGPELMQLLIEGSQREVKVPCDSMAQMKHLQHRIHSLRGAMARERHPQYAIATRAKTALTWNKEAFPGKFPREATNCILTIAPHDSQFKDLLEKAGVTVTPAARDVLEEIEAPSTPDDPSIQSSPEAVTPEFNPYK